MTRQDYILLAMVAAGIITNFLGAAFTVARILAFLKARTAAGNLNAPQSSHMGVLDFAFSFPALVAELKTVRSLDEFARVLEKHTADHALGTSIAVVATIMAAAGIMAAAILG